MRNNNENTTRSVGNEQGAGGDKHQSGHISADLPDSTTKSPLNQRVKRHSRSYNNKNASKTQTPVSSDSTNQSNIASMAPVTATASN